MTDHMVERSDVEQFLDHYRAAFQRSDIAAITAFFAFPCQVTSASESVSVTSFPGPESWTPQIERIVGAYRLLGVTSASVVELEVIGSMPRVGVAAVRWRLADGIGREVYQFDAVYYLADLGEGLRITGIAHNETPRLGAAIAALATN